MRRTLVPPAPLSVPVVLDPPASWLWPGCGLCPGSGPASPILVITRRAVIQVSNICPPQLGASSEQRTDCQLRNSQGAFDREIAARTHPGSVDVLLKHSAKDDQPVHMLLTLIAQRCSGTDGGVCGEAAFTQITAIGQDMTEVMAMKQMQLRKEQITAVLGRELGAGSGESRFEGAWALCRAVVRGGGLSNGGAGWRTSDRTSDCPAVCRTVGLAGGRAEGRKVGRSGGRKVGRFSGRKGGRSVGPVGAGRCGSCGG